jgi:PAS domain S-box-containing protein
MEKPSSSKTELTVLRNYFWMLLVLWIVLVGSILLWSLIRVKHETEEVARIQARSSFEKDLVYRRWATGHGGVYVPMTDKTQPNPYLSHVEERDIETPSGRKLTLMNPAYMTRQVHEMGAASYGLRGHITSIRPIRPANAADEWETKALRAFEQGVKEVSSIEKLDNQNYMRLMRPMVTEQGCLKCHAKQGYKMGDLRGGISVSVPMAPIQAIARGHALRLAVGHFVLWLLGVGGISLGGQRLKQRIQERKYAEEQIANLAKFPSENPNPVLRIASNGVLLYANNSSGSFLAKWDCAVGKIVPEKWRQMVSEAFASNLAKGVEIEHAQRTFSFVFAPVVEADYVNLYGQDITDRKQAAEALWEAEEKYRTLTESSLTGIFIQQDGMYVFVNDRFAEIHGFTPEELLGKEYRSLIHPHEGEFVAQRVAKRLEGKEVLQRYETRRLKKDGQTIWCEMMTSRIEYMGKFAIMGNIIDITERKQAENELQKAYDELDLRVQERTSKLTEVVAALRKEITEHKQTEKLLKDSEARFRMIYEHAPIMIDAFDGNGQCVMWNKECEKTFGWTMEEINAHDEPLSLFYPDPRVRSEVMKTVGAKASRVFHEWHPVTKDGTKLVTLWANFKLPDGAVINLGQNITERKRAEEVLHQSEEKYRGIFDESIASVYVFDEKKHFIDSNQAGLDLLGYSRDELFSMSIHDVDADPIVVLPAHKQLLSGENIVNYEHQLRRKNGTIITVLNNSRPLTDTEGNVIGMQSTLIDITERKQVEGEIQRLRDEYTHIARVSAMGELTASLAHELKQPLAAIRSNAQAAQRFLSSDKPDIDELHEILKDIIKDDRRADDVIGKLRALMRKSEIQFKPLSINTVVQDILPLVNSYEIARNISLKLKLDKNIPHVTGDLTQLQQVILNLIFNSTEALMKTKVKLCTIVVRTNQEDTQSVTVSVADNGPGIEEKVMSHLFEPFYTTKKEGLGMGLAISQTIIEEHGGRLWAENNPDSGATFYFTIPIGKRNSA